MPLLRCLQSAVLLTALTITPALIAQETAEPEPPAAPAGEIQGPTEQQIEEEPAPPPGPDFTEANELIRTGDLAGAESALAGQHEAFPDDPRLLLLHGEVLLALARPEDALPLLRRAAEVDGERPRVHFQLATALQATGDFEGALAAYLRETEINENDGVRVMARLNRMMLLEKAGDLASAVGELEEVVSLDPSRVPAYGDLATLYLQAGKLDEAASTLHRGMEQGFRSARHHHTLGVRYYEAEAYDAAIRAFRTAIEIDPASAGAELSLAGALDRAGRPEEALVHFRRFLELDPDAPDAPRVSERIAAIQGN